MPVLSQVSHVDIGDNEIVLNDKMIPDSELTLPQVEALNSIDMGRSTNSNWSTTGGSMEDDEIYEMVLDSQGNVIVCGTIYQASQFGAIQVYTEGEGDILIAKLSTTGIWEWAVSAGTALYYDECRGVTVDSNDNVYGTGYFQGSVNFGENITISTTGFDGWIARVNSTGQFDWAMKFGGFDVDVGWDIVADNYDNLYVTGFYQNFTEFDASLLTADSQNGNYRFFVAYYNMSSLGWDWAKDSGGTGNSVPTFLIRDLKIVNPILLNNKHVSTILKSKTGFSIKSVSFNSINSKIGEYLMNYKKNVNVIGQINENIWNDKKALQLTIRDVIL